MEKGTLSIAEGEVDGKTCFTLPLRRINLQDERDLCANVVYIAFWESLRGPHNWLFGANARSYPSLSRKFTRE